MVFRNPIRVFDSVGKQKSNKARFERKSTSYNFSIAHTQFEQYIFEDIDRYITDRNRYEKNESERDENSRLTKTENTLSECPNLWNIGHGSRHTPATPVT